MLKEYCWPDCGSQTPCCQYPRGTASQAFQPPSRSTRGWRHYSEVHDSSHSTHFRGSITFWIYSWLVIGEEQSANLRPIEVCLYKLCQRVAMFLRSLPNSLPLKISRSISIFYCAIKVERRYPIEPEIKLNQWTFTPEQKVKFCWSASLGM